MNKRVLVVSHMNTLRALVKIIEPKVEIKDFNLPTATPLVVEMDN